MIHTSSLPQRNIHHCAGKFWWRHPRAGIRARLAIIATTPLVNILDSNQLTYSTCLGSPVWAWTPPWLPSGLCPAETDGETGSGFWTELSGFLVLPKFRGQGIGKLLYKSAFQDAEDRKRNIYVVSCNPAMQKIMRGSNLTIITKFRQLPRVIRLHSLSFIISWYRLFETIRKALFMKKSGKFIFGYKIF